jgi:hypothetical protein
MAQLPLEFLEVFRHADARLPIPVGPSALYRRGRKALCGECAKGDVHHITD